MQQPQQPQQTQQQQYQCTKCGFGQGIMQLREVTVTIGWQKSIVKTVAPCVMCQQCGNLTVAYDVRIGDFVNLAPAPATAAPDPQLELPLAKSTPDMDKLRAAAKALNPPEDDTPTQPSEERRPAIAYSGNSA